MSDYYQSRPVGTPQEACVLKRVATVWILMCSRLLTRDLTKVAEIASLTMMSRYAAEIIHVSFENICTCHV